MAQAESCLRSDGDGKEKDLRKWPTSGLATHIDRPRSRSKRVGRASLGRRRPTPTTLAKRHTQTVHHPVPMTVGWTGARTGGSLALGGLSFSRH